MTSIKSTLLTLNLTSNQGVFDIGYGISKDVLLSLSHVQISFADTTKSGAAGSIINIDLGELTSHSSLNGNLSDEQLLTLTNDISQSVTHYQPALNIGLDKNVPTRINYRILKSDGTLVQNLTSITLQFNYIYIKRQN